MDQALTIIDIVRLGASGLVIALGLVLMAGGVIGVLRFPDFYTRLHASGVANAVGMVVVIIGLAIAAWDWRIALKLVLLAALVAACAPTLAHLSANAAHAAGLSPIAGPYVAPRPGEKRPKDERA